MLLEILFGWFSTFQLHALYHHVFGRIYFKIKKGPGYTYLFRNCIFKGSPPFGYVTTAELYLIWGKYWKNGCE